MHLIHLDAPSSLHVHIPPADQWSDLTDTGQSFVTYDQSLPPDQQCFYTPYIANLLQTCIPLCDTFDDSESKRTMASEAVKRLDEQSTHLTRRIHSMIKSYLYDTPEKAEKWGFQIKQSTKSILMPKSRKDRLAMFKKYIAKEESRPAEERFTTPDLATVKEVRDGLVEHLAARRSGRDMRKSSRAARDEAFGKLVDCLRMAAGDLMIRFYDHKVSFEMQKWGLEIVERQNGRADRSEEEAAAEEATEATTPEPTTPEPTEPESAPTDGDMLNGTVEAVVELNGQGT